MVDHDPTVAVALHVRRQRPPPPDIALVEIRRTRLGRRQIVCHRFEWRRPVDELKLPYAQRRVVDQGVTQAMTVPGSAVTWNHDRHRLEVGRGSRSAGRHCGRSPNPESVRARRCCAATNGSYTTAPQYGEAHKVYILSVLDMPTYDQ